MEKKKLKRFFNLKLLVSSAVFEDSSIGPNLSPFMPREKINLFCSEFNELSKSYISDLKLFVKLYLYTNNSFFFVIKGPCFLDFIKILNLSTKFNIDNFLYLKELYDIILLKNYFLGKNFKFNNFFIKRLILCNIYSIKNLKLKNEFF